MGQNCSQSCIQDHVIQKNNLKERSIKIEGYISDFDQYPPVDVKNKINSYFPYPLFVQETLQKIKTNVIFNQKYKNQEVSFSQQKNKTINNKENLFEKDKDNPIEQLSQQSQQNKQEEYYFEYQDGSIFSGTYQNGSKQGYGKYYNSKEDFFYEGEFEKDQMTGQGLLIKQNRNYYKGQFNEGELNGYGEFMDFQNNSCYKGQLQQGIKNGLGWFVNLDFKYYGQFVQDQKQGHGEIYFQDSSYYVGQFENDYINGYGHYFYANQSQCKANFKDGQLNGYGEFRWKEGQEYKGNYVNNEKEGEGTFYWPDGRSLKIQWKNGLQNGIGIYTNTAGIQRQGQWNNGIRIKWLE